MTEIRRRIYQKLHATYAVRRFENEDVWTGNLDLDDLVDVRLQARLVGRAELVGRIRSS